MDVFNPLDDEIRNTLLKVVWN